jgi:hypothetical protein
MNALQRRGWLGSAKNQRPPQTAAAKTIFSKPQSNSPYWQLSHEYPDLPGCLLAFNCAAKISCQAGSPIKP